MAKMKVDFKISPFEEAKIIPRVIQLLGEGVIAEPYRRKIKNLSGEVLAKKIKLIHKEQKREINKKRSDTEIEWRKIEKEYFKLFQNLTGYKPSLDKDCYFSPTILGFADVCSGKKIFVSPTLPQDHLNYVMPHEITHLLYRDILANSNDPILNNVKGMAFPLMEGIDHLIIFKSPIYNLLNTSLRYEDIGFIKRNPEFMNQMENLWIYRKNFVDFLKKAIKLAEKTKSIIP